LKGFTGVAKIALKSRSPVIPVGMVGTYEIMSRHDKRPKLKKAKIVIGEPLYFTEYHNIEQKDHHFREITDKIMLKIAELTGEEYFHIEIGQEVKKEREIV
jgi:1-acyl-sn-glycerol-3-phosphate acyltransferase